MTKFLSLLLISLFLFSCGKTADERRNDAVLSANILLTNKECQKAIELLESVGRDTYNGKYMQVLASAYACKSGYSELTFFVDDISKIGTPAVLGGLTRFALSNSMTTYDSASFVHLQSAIDILLYAGGLSSTANPTSALRAQGLNALDAQDLNAQLMYMLLTQMGMYLYHYGDSSATGVKGSGAGANTCLVNYSNVALDVGVNLSTYLTTPIGPGPVYAAGACHALNSGHAELGTQNNLNVERLCQGIVLLNNFIDVFPSVLAAATSADLNTVNGITAAINLAKTAVTTAKNDADMLALMSMTNQSRCVTNYTGKTDYLEIYMAFMYETLFQ